MPGPTGVSGLIEKQYGIRTRHLENREGTVCNIAVTRILRQNPNRIAAVVLNLSANVIYIAPRNAPSSTAGVRLDPSGGRMTLLWFEDFHLTGMEWNGTATADASSIYVLEVEILAPGEG